MQVTLRAVRMAAPGLKALVKEKLPMRLASRIERIATQAEQESTRFEKHRNARMLELCVKDEHGKPIILKDEHGERIDIPAEHAEQFGVELAELLDECVEVPYAPLKLSQFPASWECSAQQLAALGPLIEADVLDDTTPQE